MRRLPMASMIEPALSGVPPNSSFMTSSRIINSPKVISSTYSSGRR
jgi:hypothetical protein